MQVLEPQCAVGIEDIVHKVNQRGHSVVFLGDGVPVFRTFIQEHCNVPFTFAPPHLNKQRAAALAALGILYYQQGRIETAAEHRPDYLRLSQAERERLAQNKEL